MFAIRRGSAFAKAAPRSRVVSASVLSIHESYPASVNCGSDLGWKSDFSKSYLQGRLIGTGSFGVVYSGISFRSGQEVSIKVMPKTRLKQTKDRTLQKIVRETNLLQRLQAVDGVVRLEDCFEDDASVAIVMEYCKGGDLQKYVEANGPLTERQLALVAREVLRVVSSCHSLGVLHGDVKPQNFCLKAAQNPLNLAGMESAPGSWLKALDFGCSQRLTGSDRAKKRTGTPAFMAPEIYLRDYGQRVDVWSTGVMLYWLYTLQFPFFSGKLSMTASKLDEVKEAVLTGPISYDFGPWSSMSEQGMDFIQCCLQRQENMRISVSEALQHPWLISLDQEGGGRPS